MAYGHCKPTFLPQFTRDNRSSSSRGFEMGPDHTVSCPRCYVSVIWSWGSLRLVWDWRTRKRGTEPVQLASGHLQAPPQARPIASDFSCVVYTIAIICSCHTSLQQRKSCVFVHPHIYKRKIRDINRIVIWAVQNLWPVLVLKNPIIMKKDVLDLCCSENSIPCECSGRVDCLNELQGSLR